MVLNQADIYYYFGVMLSELKSSSMKSAISEIRSISELVDVLKLSQENFSGENVHSLQRYGWLHIVCIISYGAWAIPTWALPNRTPRLVLWLI